MKKKKDPTEIVFICLIGCMSVFLLAAAYAIIVEAHAFTLPEHARKKTQQAILAIPKVRHAKKVTEKRVYRSVASVTGLSKTQLATTSAILKSASEGEITTRDLRIRMNVLGAKISPLVEYNWRDNTALGSIKIDWSW